MPGHAAWRRPSSHAERIYDYAIYRRIAQQAEAAKLDYLFVADGPTHEADRFLHNPFRILESLTLVTSLVGVTERIGLIPSLSTTFFEPFNIARQLASLDHLSGGRAGWNVVTSFGGAEHYGPDELLEHDLRYARAEEFLQAVELFWRSWADGALVRDRRTGTWGDPRHVAAESFDGRFFKIRGPLNLPAGPQGRPVIAQAGSSDIGRSLGARYADLIYTGASSLARAQAFRADIRDRAAAAGRQPSAVKIVPSVSPIIGATESEARAMEADLNDLIDFEAGRRSLQWMLGDLDLSGFDLDEPIPTDYYPTATSTNRVQSHIDNFRPLAVDQRLTIRQLILVNVRGGGGWSVVGSVEQVADALQDRFEDLGADGYTLSAPYQPEGFDWITSALVPELQARGLFHTDYEHPTLRDSLTAASKAALDGI
ncbi:NtaA/DmoA family FMN-dependent monooxygenase [Xylophilus sp.]|uniref:NtaA/DmoA family FMN-dependent monooxygenase n=1 Tax=Xylophilus sp. TaxID=2653893 RepID=UPI002D801F43|nr:NtaA/DmoA family FMN-dependent monooxygenase [Xylophilus sp.]